MDFQGNCPAGSQSVQTEKLLPYIFSEPNCGIRAIAKLPKYPITSLAINISWADWMESRMGILENSFPLAVTDFVSSKRDDSTLHEF